MNWSPNTTTLEIDSISIHILNLRIYKTKQLARNGKITATNEAKIGPEFKVLTK